MDSKHVHPHAQGQVHGKAHTGIALKKKILIGATAKLAAPFEPNRSAVKQFFLSHEEATKCG